MKKISRELRAALSVLYKKASGSDNVHTKLDRSQIDPWSRNRGSLVPDTHPCSGRSVHKLCSDFVTKQSFRLRCCEYLLASPTKITALNRSRDDATYMRRLLILSSSTRSQSVNRFDCMAMWELKRN
jgi:hypothetical protein